jgi:hypothetical protein
LIRLYKQWNEFVSKDNSNIHKAMILIDSDDDGDGRWKQPSEAGA